MCQSARARARVAVTLAALCLFAGAGCQRSQPEAVEVPKPVTMPRTLPPKTELAAKGSGLYSLTTVYGGLSGQTVCEIRLVYESGESGVMRFRDTDGSLSETEERFAGTNIVKSRATYSADGKTVIAGKLYRSDGSLRLALAREDDGLMRMDRYWFDGSYVCLSLKGSPEAAGVPFKLKQT